MKRLKLSNVNIMGQIRSKRAGLSRSRTYRIAGKTIRVTPLIKGKAAFK